MNCDGCFGAADLQCFECPKEDKRWKSIFPIDDTKREPEPMWPKENPSIKK